MKYTKDNRDVAATVKVLFEISNAVNNTENLDELYASIHKSLNKIINLENFAIAIYHKEKDSMTFPYFVDELDTQLGEVFNISEKQSLSARVINAGEPLMFYDEDILKMPNRAGRIAFHSTCKVWAGAPLKIKGQSFGALFVQSYRSKDAFRKSDLDLLNSVAEFVAVSIDRKQTQIAHKQSDEISRVLREIARSVHTSENLSKLFETIHHTLSQIIDVSNFFIAIVDTKERTLHFPYCVDTMDDDFSPITDFNAQDSLTGLVVSQRKPILLKTEELKKRARQKGVWGPVPLTWMGAPLIIKDKVIGVIAVQSYLDATLYDKRHLQLLTAVSDQIAIAIYRKRAEDSLHESEKKFRQIYNNILDIYFEASLDGVIIEISPSIVKYSQYKPEELIGKSLYNFFAKFEDRDHFIKLIINKGFVNNYEIGLIFSNDNHHIFSVNCELLHDHANNLVKLIGIMRDVSDIKMNEYERERSLSLLKATFESTADGILVVDREGIWSNFNQKFIDIWDIPSHLLETNDYEQAKEYVVNTTLDPESFTAKLRELYNDFTAHSFDVIGLKNDKIFECYSSPQSIGEDIVGRVWSFRDITERKRIENALRVSEEKLSSISKQTEQLSLAAASMISIKDEQVFFNKVSKAIVDFSDFKRVIISLFKNTPPFRDIIAFGGVEERVIDRLKRVEMPRQWYDNVFVDENIIGHFSYYIPHTKKHLLNQEATIFGSGAVDESEKKWHPEDNLFVRMNDEKSNIIGVISVDESKSGLKPNAETVRPLEIFSSLISQIIILKREQKERRKAELWASEQRLALMVEQSPLAVIEWNPDFEVIKWNLVAEQMFGYTAEEAKGHHLAELLVSEETRLKVDQLWQELIEQRGGAHFINDNITKDGRTITCEWHNTSLVNAEGKTSGVLSVIQDITERYLAEKELIAAKEQAEEATRTKSIFLANMSHELRTPLNAILGFSGLMMRDENLSKEQLRNLKSIGHSGEHLLDLIDDVLQFSKIESGRVMLQPENFDLYRLLFIIEEMFSLRAREKGLILKVDKSADVPQFVRADQGKLRQTLINILGNAVKFTNQGGITLRVRSENQTLFFEVEDTGVGIAQEELAMVFDIFVQTSSGQESKQGSGLGIPISQKFVTMMGGGLMVESEVEKGTIFRFDVQVELIDNVEAVSTESESKVIGLAPEQPKYRLVVAEDHEPSSRMLVALLRKVGFDVSAAVNGQEAVKLWEQQQPHLIWMDLRMPLLDGYEATKSIKSAMKKAQSAIDTKIIALTANAFEENKVKALESGCSDFVRKPFRESDIFNIMTKYLGVRYIYEEDKEERNRTLNKEERLPATELQSMLSGLSSTLLNDLAVASGSCNADEIDRIIDDIRDLDNNLGNSLAQLSEKFAYKEIMGLIDKVKDPIAGQ